MSGVTIVDTDILIDAGRQVREAIDCLNRIEERSMLAISVITHMELLVGCRNKTELRSVELFLQRFQVVTLSEKVCAVAIELLRRYRLSHGLLIPDALIAATAMELKFSFVSKNQRDYRYISKLQLLTYPDLLASQKVAPPMRQG